MLVDTPSLVEKDSFSMLTLTKIKKYVTKNNLIDILMFCKRIDIYRDEPLDKEIIVTLTEHLGPDIWRRTIMVLTRAGSPLSMVLWCTSKGIHSIQRDVCQASGRCVRAIAFVENCRARKASDGQMVLPDGTAWLPSLLECAFKIIKSDPKPYDFCNLMMPYDDYTPLLRSHILREGEKEQMRLNCDNRR